MKTIIIILILIALGGIGWYLYTTQVAGETPKPLTAPSPAPSPIIEMTAAGFAPAEITIKAGDKVTFVNKDTKNHWPASGVHPTHLLCPGFEAIGGVKPSESYSFTFTEKKECPMHDHLFPQLRGKITVE